MADSQYISPQQRLANSRQAIVRHMHHEMPDEAEHEDSDIPTGDNEFHRSRIWDLIRQMSTSWWQRHPAHLALTLTKPLVQAYAGEKPLKLLAISAAIGAATIVIRPWRLISVTGLLLAALKSAEMSNAIKSFLTVGSHPKNTR